jgi:hypothetical protein
MKEKEIAAVFEEWQRQYREDPESFEKDKETAKKTVSTYGQGAAKTFLRIRKELEKQ